MESKKSKHHTVAIDHLRDAKDLYVQLIPQYESLGYASAVLRHMENGTLAAPLRDNPWLWPAHSARAAMSPADSSWALIRRTRRPRQPRTRRAC